MLYGHCENVLANISQIEQEANNMRDSELRETVITKSNAHFDKEERKSRDKHKQNIGQAWTLMGSIKDSIELSSSSSEEVKPKKGVVQLLKGPITPFE